MDIDHSRFRWRLSITRIVTLLITFDLILISAGVTATETPKPLAHYRFDNKLLANNGLIMESGAQLTDQGKHDGGLSLLGNATTKVSIPAAFSARQGTLSFWVNPQWPANDTQSHTFLSLRWQHPKNSYLTISQGWWEPGGVGRLYFVLSNQEEVHCSAPFHFQPGRWRLITAVWQAGQAGYCKLFVDGERMAHWQGKFIGDYPPAGPLWLGTDVVTTVAAGRQANAFIDDLRFFSVPFGDLTAYQDYEVSETIKRERDRPRWDWLSTALNESPSTSQQPALAERRVMFDESNLWSVSKENVDKIIADLKAGGFNVYVPCIWHSGAARYLTHLGLMESWVREPPAPDLLSYLIQQAHKAGIEVHPWFTVMLRTDTSPLTKFYGAGVPDKAFNVQDPNFRDYISEVILDVVQRYPVDGINLDYIRSMGACTTMTCQTDYLSRYRTPLDQDLANVYRDPAAHARISNWNGEAVTDIVQKIRLGSQQIRPGIILSVDSVPLEAGKILQGQNSVVWANANLIDVVFYMNYPRQWDVAGVERARAQMKQPEKLTNILRIFDGAANSDSEWIRIHYDPEALADSIRLIRRRWPNTGVAFYHNLQYSDAQRKALRREVFNTTVLPAWPSKPEPP